MRLLVELHIIPCIRTVHLLMRAYTPTHTQTDYANRDARAAFFSRMESGEPVGPPRFPGPGNVYIVHVHVQHK